MTEFSLLILVITVVAGLLLLAGVAVVALAAMFPKFRRIILQISAVGVVGLVLLICFLMFVSVAYVRRSDHVAVQQFEAHAARDKVIERHESSFEDTKEPGPELPSVFTIFPAITAPSPRTDGPNAEAKTSETAPADDAKAADPPSADPPAAAAEPSPPAQPPAAPPRPEWLEAKPNLAGEVYRHPLASGLFVTPGECEEAIAPKIDAAIQDYAERWLGVGRMPAILATDELRTLARKQDYFETVASPTVGPMQQLHVLLEFDKPFRDTLSDLARKTTLQSRITQSLIIAGLVVGVLTVLYMYLQAAVAAQKATNPSPLGRLRFAASTAILLIVFAALVAWRRLLP